MFKGKTGQKKSILILMTVVLLIAAFLIGRLANLMIVQCDYYNELADELHTRERRIKASRGNIYDRNGVLIASNRTVCTISVIYNQIEDPERVIAVLCEELGLEEENVRKKVEKWSAREIIKTNVDKEIGDKIREYDLAGVKVDEDYKRYYPFGDVASHVIGFTGSDNQGIIGLEVEYESVLKGTDGIILTLTDAAGIEVEEAAEDRIEPVAGNDLYLTLDMNIQQYAQQVAESLIEQKQAKQVCIIIMNPSNGEIYAMVNVPEFDLNNPYELNVELSGNETEQERQNLLNQMWRNTAVSDTYEPGSTFKTVTAAAALEAGVVTLQDTFSCPGYYIVEDRKIRCARTSGHGGETFLQGIMNSCNPVFIQVGLRMGKETLYQYLNQYQLTEKTGIDLPGEAGLIMHKQENMGDVELATVSFGQSFQLTRIRLLTTVSAIINGGKKIVPHFGMEIHSSNGVSITKLEYDDGEQIVSEEVSEAMRYALEQVVAAGGGKNAYIEGYRIGGKTATSEKLPRRSGKYISSFYGFAPADNPQVLAFVSIDEPTGTYYGGMIAAPVVKDIYENILPYLGIEKKVSADTETEE
ncbi:MAG: peptidoglycan D,D-transpeptidase FtsI family protein [Lachnospiraceae bacterium]